MSGLASPISLQATPAAGEAGLFKTVVSSRRLRTALLVLPVGLNAAPAPRMDVGFATVIPQVTAAADDPAWADVEWTRLAALGSRPTGASTEVAALWNDDALFVRFRCEGVSGGPYGRTHDAPHHEGEVVEVFLDATATHDRFLEIQLSPAGGVMDKAWSLDRPIETGPDGLLTPGYSERYQRGELAWTLSGLRTAVSTPSTPAGAPGWLADLAFPWSSLGRDDPKPGGRLRAHFVRIWRPKDRAETGYFSWAVIPLGRPHRAPALMGTLELRSHPMAKADSAGGRSQ